MAETAVHAACRNALDQYVRRVINSGTAQATLVANGVPNDPDGTGTAYSAQQATLSIDQGASVSDVLTSLGV